MTHSTRQYLLAVALVAALLAGLLLRVFVFPPGGASNGQSTAGPARTAGGASTDQPSPNGQDARTIRLRPTGAANLPAGQAGATVGRYEPVGIMGTDTKLTAIGSSDRPETIREALAAAEAALRRVEALMSTHIRHSELSTFNRAAPGEFTELSPQLMGLLRTAKQLAEQSDGAFDVTIAALIDLWKRAGRNNQLPTNVQIEAAMAICGWENIELREKGAIRLDSHAGVDLGGIAKGYGIDRAVEAMQRAGCSAGLVDVGGDMRFFGRKPDGQPWTFSVRNPFGQGFIGTFKMEAGAVCTSGNYQRFTQIDGKRYSHIIDPRTGWPAEAAPSVTVLAPAATVADAWATALSVLGPAGLDRLPDGVEALLVIGAPGDSETVTTEGFMDRHQIRTADEQP